MTKYFCDFCGKQIPASLTSFNGIKVNVPKQGRDYYITVRSEADFRHDICIECLLTLVDKLKESTTT